MADRSKNRVRDKHVAGRIARAIVSDVLIYNTKALADGKVQVDDGFEANLREGRKLYESRVVPELDGLFDEVAADLLAAGGIPYARAEASATASAPLGPPVRVPPVPGFREASHEALAVAPASATDLERLRQRLRRFQLLAAVLVAVVAVVLVWLGLR